MSGIPIPMAMMMSDRTGDRDIRREREKKGEGEQGKEGEGGSEVRRGRGWREGWSGEREGGCKGVR